MTAYVEITHTTKDKRLQFDIVAWVVLKTVECPVRREDVTGIEEMEYQAITLVGDDEDREIPEHELHSMLTNAEYDSLLRDLVAAEEERQFELWSEV